MPDRGLYVLSESKPVKGRVMLVWDYEYSAMGREDGGVGSMGLNCYYYKYS